MYINKDKLKKIVCGGLVLVNTMLPVSGKAFNYYYSGKDNLYNVARTIYGDGKYLKDILEYNNLSNSNILKGMLLEIPSFEELLSKRNKKESKYNTNIINGIKLNKDSDDNIVGIYIRNRFNNNWGYINCVGYNNASIEPNSLITVANDCNFNINGAYISGDGYDFYLNAPLKDGNYQMISLSLVDFNTNGAFISGDGYDFYLNVPLKDGNYQMISLSLVDFNTVKNSNNHKPLRECSNYVLKNNFNVDKDGNIVSFTINTIDKQVLNVFVTNPESNFKFDYNNFDYNNNPGIEVVTVNYNIVGFGLKRIDGKYDYVGVSPEFSFDYYDSLFNNDIVKKEEFDIKKN